MYIGPPKAGGTQCTWVSVLCSTAALAAVAPKVLSVVIATRMCRLRHMRVCDSAVYGFVSACGLFYGVMVAMIAVRGCRAVIGPISAVVPIVCVTGCLAPRTHLLPCQGSGFLGTGWFIHGVRGARWCCHIVSVVAADSLVSECVSSSCGHRSGRQTQLCIRQSAHDRAQLSIHGVHLLWGTALCRACHGTGAGINCVHGSVHSVV